jgi:DNA polymerase-3 subunit beta
VKLNFRHNLLELSSSNPELGDAREELDMEYQGTDLSVGFNARYLLDILQVQDQDKICMILKDNLSPGLVKPIKDDGYLAVIMPMRL